ncbi:MAG: T9SS type A sorting domain-containing protein [Candidatus Saccharibacteria bacterium]
MRKLLIVYILLSLVYIGSAQNKWKKEKIQAPLTVCYASGESYSTYVGMPAEYYKRLKSANARVASIEVTYVGFTPEAQQAFQFAVDIWKNLVYSPVPIKIKATWRSLDKGVLGSCGPGGYYKNFDATQKWDTYYPVALAEKFTGEEINSPDQYELVADFNSDFSNWYLGIDGKTPSRQYDFVSVVLHELTHGLGFTGLMFSNQGKGMYSYGTDPLAAVFDQHIIDKNNQYLLNKSIYPNPSVALQLALTSDWLQFYIQQSQSNIPKLYAPATWNEGSSLYHLDDATYPAGDVNSLMTPYTGMGEAIHNPGPQALAMMYEMGWKNITIKHQPLKDIEYPAAVDFKAQIESDNALDLSKLYLVYSTSRFAKTDSSALKTADIANNYSVQLSQFKNGEVDYYFAATDQTGHRFVYPSNAPLRYLSFKIGIDRQAPVIKHEPVKYMLSSYPSAKIDAQVTDNLGLKSVYVEYLVNGGTMKQLPLENKGKDIYSGTLSLPKGSVKGGEKVSYRIVAVDASSQANTIRNPLSGYYSFTVEEIRNPSLRYINNFNLITNDFIGSDFYLSTPTGFDSRALNSPHPYSSPEVDNMEYNFTTILRNPIILAEGGKMNYDEIVMVEPADSGSRFGDENFWDYVIVEGSKDGGNSWRPLTDGYDSNWQASWLSAYKSSTSGNNSTAVPTKDLYVNHQIDLLANGNFSAGDTILVRFRLYSDPYSNGWGWVIDNLKIQEGVSNVASLLSSGEVLLYPNPASGILNVDIQSKSKIGSFVVKAYNVSGSEIYNRQFPMDATDYHGTIDISNFSQGLYLFTIEVDQAKKVTRKILIQ